MQVHEIIGARAQDLGGSGYSTSLSVPRGPGVVFDSVNDVRGWWSTTIDGVTDRVGAEFTYRYDDVHLCRLRVVDLVPGRRVVWQVVSNWFSFTEDQSEWPGTTIEFDISGVGDESELRFVHRGLLPAHECYAVCSSAWTGYITGSLRQLVLTGRGQPNGGSGDAGAAAG